MAQLWNTSRKNSVEQDKPNGKCIFPPQCGLIMAGMINFLTGPPHCGLA